jgi:hypothetical protein
VGGFYAGSWWHAAFVREPPPGRAEAPIAHDPPPCRELPAAKRATVEALPVMPAAEDPRCAEVSAALLVVRGKLAQAVGEQQAHDEQRVQREGAPPPPEKKPREPRFEPEALRSAVSGAFVEAKVPGRVAGLDCSEWPCIVYGRIRGTEDEMEKLEGAKALAAYGQDILTVLLWVVTDEAATAAPVPGLPGRPEQSLFAFAWYPRGLERALADNLDRRLRTRTADLWNTMSPSDETGR